MFKAFMSGFSDPKLWHDIGSTCAFCLPLICGGLVIFLGIVCVIAVFDYLLDL